MLNASPSINALASLLAGLLAPPLPTLAAIAQGRQRRSLARPFSPPIVIAHNARLTGSWRW